MNTTRRPGRHRPPGGANPIAELAVIARESAQPAMKGAAILAAAGGLVSTLAPPAEAESQSTASANAPAVTGPPATTWASGQTAVQATTVPSALTSIGFTRPRPGPRSAAAKVITDVIAEKEQQAAQRAVDAKREAQSRASRDLTRRSLTKTTGTSKGASNPAPSASNPTPSASNPTPSASNAAPSATAGGRSPYNWGSAGQCTWGVLNKWYQSEGYYPGGWTGNALVWGTRAANAGYTVSGTPRTRSIVVMQPGVHGSSSAGHLGWVTAVNGDRVTIIEMNALAGPFNYNTRTVTDISGMRYIYAP
ncbi:hypothetical protein GCM10009740_16100 [Terrabacter terrae]|uniref:Peptidase C51 domain-containing protein n=1 Tax=Terrabacter terrae TaxID=318434 RepID=A0ABP5FID5_9MICO